MTHISKRVEKLMKLRAQVIIQHPFFAGADPEDPLTLQGEAVVAQYVMAAAMLEVDESISYSSQVE